MKVAVGFQIGTQSTVMILGDPGLVSPVRLFSDSRRREQPPIRTYGRRFYTFSEKIKNLAAALGLVCLQ